MKEKQSLLSVRALQRRPDFTLDVDFESNSALTALFGPSGSGKTSILNLIAGVHRPARGRIVVAGNVLTDTEAGIFIPMHQRRVGVVFQDAQLFPHLTVQQNIKFGQWFTRMHDQGLPLEVIVEVLGIGSLMKRRPATLSGGERHRVALARALLSSPRILLMDEPLAALDDARRSEIMSLIERIRDEFRVPIVYVTHNVEEVRRLALRVVRINAGRVVSTGTAAEVLGS
ncbi:molybdenum ABC transporter ATP-binding protein [Hyphomicrobium sp.]|uniref:molybdenum ABC transporter ATP-binding protein n=1 Tax=Hyphomicrobium sp. TaxID=82 RepID=UPI001E0F121D|nr:molybdenum ABC transporter ATP-binding protein [Hyphomicrobium sp.]MBY0558396.1 molybdenum ABC transporter ATP-binding protein [Hyphomicrobium sp.]